jgi:site-specific recombinase XerD
MKLSICLHQFFDRYLGDIKGVDKNTIKSYRDSFKLFLPFLASYYKKPVKALAVEDISMKVIFAFLDYLERKRDNTARTRNHRLAILKSFAVMLELIYPEYKELARQIHAIPFKRYQKGLVGFITQEEILSIYDSVDLKKYGGFRDYTILHLLFDTGMRASEIAGLHLDSFDATSKSLIILGKGNKFRQITLSLKTTELMEEYIAKYRISPKPRYDQILFINKHRKGFTRSGIYRLCKKYLRAVLPPKRLQVLSAVHSFRHGSAMAMLSNGESLTTIKNRLGHEHIETTMTYLQLDIERKREIQNRLLAHTESSIKSDVKINDLLGWENEEDTLAWLDSL